MIDPFAIHSKEFSHEKKYCRWKCQFLIHGPATISIYFIFLLKLQYNKGSTPINDECAVPENIHAHPTEGHWKFRGGGGSRKP